MNARLFLDTRVSKGEAPLKIAIAHEKRTAYIPIGVKLLPTQWNGHEVKDHKNKAELNIFIRGQLSAVERQMLILREMGKTRGKSATEIRDMIECELNPEKKEKMESEKSFLYRFNRVISLKTGQTKDSYEWTLKRIKEYDKRLEKRTFDDINYDYLNDFLNHCHELSINSRSILMRNIRHVFNDAIDAGITECYPFRKLRIRREATRKKALNAGQMRLLMDSDSKQENEYRDMFMLMFYLRGINPVDLFSARLTQVVNGRLEYRRSKVGALLSVKIEPEAWEIINRYKGKEYLLNAIERYKDYRSYACHLNVGLKRIGCVRGKGNVVKREGYFPLLSANWARHSWVSIAANIGISKEVVSWGVAHSFGSSVTDIYMDFDMKLVDQANRRLIDYIKAY